MAGKNQHYIPRSMQRAFQIPASRDDKRQVFTFRRLKSFVQNVDNSAAEDYFYSRPKGAGEKTLDDIITDYEAEFFTQNLHGLLEAAEGSVDATVAASIVAHLVVRVRTR